MKDDVAAAVMPVAMAPLREMLDAVVAKAVPIFVWTVAADKIVSL